MTRKYFEQLADALNRACPEHYYDPSMDDDEAAQAEWSRWDRVVSEVADVCAQTNPRFDRDAFVGACQGY